MSSRRPWIAAVTLCALAAVGACSDSTATNGIEVDNELPATIDVAVDSGPTAILAPGASSRVSAGRHPQTLTWTVASVNTTNIAAHFGLSGASLSLADTTRRLSIRPEIGDSTFFLLRVSNHTPDPIGVGMADGGITFCVAVPVARSVSSVSLGLFSLANANELHVFGTSTCTGSFLTIPHATVLANFSGVLDEATVPISIHP